jgi:hypothetical protein
MLRCAYLRSEDPQVLFWGEADDLRGLGALLAESAVSQESSVLGGDASRDQVRLSFSEAPHGMRRADGFLEWQIAPSDGSRFAELIEALIVNSGPGHQYLDCAVETGMGVKVSLGEYADDFRP